MNDKNIFRPLRRVKQEASAQECLAILESAPRGVLSVHGENGYPYAIPMNFFLSDGKIYFHCAMAGHKLDAIRADDKVCFTVLSDPVKNPGEWWNRFTSVVCFGRIAEVKGEERKNELLRTLGAKLFPAGYDIDADMSKNAHRALILEMTIDHMTGKRVREK